MRLLHTAGCDPLPMPSHHASRLRCSLPVQRAAAPRTSCSPPPARRRPLTTSTVGAAACQEGPWLGGSPRPKAPCMHGFWLGLGRQRWPAGRRAPQQPGRATTHHMPAICNLRSSFTLVPPFSLAPHPHVAAAQLAADLGMGRPGIRTTSNASSTGPSTGRFSVGSPPVSKGPDSTVSYS